MMTNKTSRWWHSSQHMDRRPILLARAKITAGVRTWFHEQGFLEVEPSCLQVSPGNEAHLHALSTEVIGPDLSRMRRYLHTSPEFSMKKLLVAGEKKIFYLGPCFRNRELGALHATEFRMLEWYRVGGTLEQLMEDTTELLRIACSLTGQKLISWRGQVTDPRHPFETLSVREAFSRYAGIDLDSSLPKREAEPDRGSFADQAERAGITVRPHDTWSDIFSRILVALIEPKLGRGQPTFLYRYPIQESPLARVCLDDARFSERFELYCSGMEIANGFGELTDANRLRTNLKAQMSLKEERYGETYPMDEDFLDAMKDMPEASGCALGFDRLVMLAAGATHINQVLWTPGP